MQNKIVGASLHSCVVMASLTYHDMHVGLVVILVSTGGGR